jgi:excisionase family DNA binding protein
MKMSLEFDPARQRKRGRRFPLPRVAVTIGEFVSSTGLSRPTVYRLMKSGRLHFAQIGGTRRIPVSEYRRLGLIAEE